MASHNKRRKQKKVARDGTVNSKRDNRHCQPSAGLSCALSYVLRARHPHHCVASPAPSLRGRSGALSGLGDLLDNLVGDLVLVIELKCLVNCLGRKLASGHEHSADFACNFVLVVQVATEVESLQTARSDALQASGNVRVWFPGEVRGRREGSTTHPNTAHEET